MDFFTLQDQARSQTKKLALLFSLAVVLIITAINLLVFVAVSWDPASGYTLESWLKEPYWIFISGSILLVVLITSLIRSYQLRSTPDSIARMVNATLVSVHSKKPEEVKLVNVVEEMSIASGTPMPKIYVMKHEHAMNAFVAGLSTENIVLVVTQGLLDNLNRQELQGVIAHEYSHVFHGDMQINVKLIGILAGILVLGQIGYFILRSGFHGSSRRDSKGNALPILAFGASLFAIGYIGLFFGRLIKAAISRQREFLADASAVQYTRDSDGICGALHKISNHSQGTLLASKKAEEMSHLCFGEAVKLRFKGMLATHPPINERIKAINPKFDYNKVQFTDSVESDGKSFNTASAFSAFVSQQMGQPSGPKERMPEIKVPKGDLVSQVGNVTPTHIDVAHQLIAKTPNKLLNIARGSNEEFSELDLIVSLLHCEQKENSPKNISPLITKRENFNAIEQISDQLSGLSFNQHHLLLEISLSRFEERQETDQRDFILELNKMIQHDGTISLTEFMLYASCARRSLKASEKTQKFSRFSILKNEIEIFISLLYQQSNLKEDKLTSSFDKNMNLLGIPNAQLITGDFEAQPFAKSLNKLGNLHPMLKKDFLELCVDIVEVDGEITQKEYELIRLLGEYLGCPFPIFNPKTAA